MKTLRTTFSLLSKDRYLRNDEKYQIVAVNKSDNIFSSVLCYAENRHSIHVVFEKNSRVRQHFYIYSIYGRQN